MILGELAGGNIFSEEHLRNFKVTAVRTMAKVGSDVFSDN
jgi:hypothetical protein